MLAAFFDIVLDEPQNWGNIAIPWPDAFVAVAVEAGALGQGAGICIPGWFLEDLRIGVLVTVGDELDEYKCGHERNHEIFGSIV